MNVSDLREVNDFVKNVLEIKEDDGDLLNTLVVVNSLLSEVRSDEGVSAYVDLEDRNMKKVIKKTLELLKKKSIIKCKPRRSSVFETVITNKGIKVNDAINSILSEVSESDDVLGDISYQKFNSEVIPYIFNTES